MTDAMTNLERRPATWRWIVTPVAIAIGSRVFSIAAIVALAAVTGSSPNQFTTWDGSWYLRIVSGGYHALAIENGHFDFAFFPAWPLLIRVATLGFLPADVVAFALSNVLFVAGATLVWRLIAERFDTATATRSTALLAFAPPAYVFSMAYAESLFVVAAAATLLARRPWLQVAFAGLAAGTRLAGLAVALAAALSAVPDSLRSRRFALILAGAGLAFAAWFVYVAVLTGNPVGFFEGSTSWMRFNVVRTQLNSITAHPVEYAARFLFVGVVLAGSILAFRRDRELGVYSLAIVGIAIMALASIPAQSIARYAMPAFPAYAGLSRWAGRRGSWVILVTFALAQVWFAAWTIGPGRVPP